MWLGGAQTFVEDRKPQMFADLDGRNRAIVIAESLARVIAAIRIASVRSLAVISPPKTQELVRGIAEWSARVDRVR